jgi:2-amino-4-hydroxy-6-hydroxymethyldihydropteridine diphosphokinase
MPGRIRIVVSIGSNLEPAMHLRKAVELLEARCMVMQIASAWETPAVGATGPNFYNSAISLLSEYDPMTLKFRVLRPIESELGRIRTSDKYAPRTIDLDPIVYHDTILDDRLWTYAYLAIPIAELAPDLPHPQTKERLADIASRLAQLTHPIPHPEVFAVIH